jgi:hypothetical protein
LWHDESENISAMEQLPHLQTPRITHDNTPSKIIVAIVGRKAPPRQQEETGLQPIMEV